MVLDIFSNHAHCCYLDLGWIFIQWVCLENMCFLPHVYAPLSISIYLYCTCHHLFSTHSSKKREKSILQRVLPVPSPVWPAPLPGSPAPGPVHRHFHWMPGLLPGRPDHLPAWVVMAGLSVGSYLLKGYPPHFLPHDLQPPWKPPSTISTSPRSFPPLDPSHKPLTS